MNSLASSSVLPLFAHLTCFLHLPLTLALTSHHTDVTNNTTKKSDQSKWRKTRDGSTEGLKCHFKCIHADRYGPPHRVARCKGDDTSAVEPVEGSLCCTPNKAKRRERGRNIEVCRRGLWEASGICRVFLPPKEAVLISNDAEENGMTASGIYTSRTYYPNTTVCFPWKRKGKRLKVRCWKCSSTEHFKLLKKRGRSAYVRNQTFVVSSSDCLLLSLRANHSTGLETMTIANNTCLCFEQSRKDQKYTVSCEQCLSGLMIPYDLTSKSPSDALNSALIGPCGFVKYVITTSPSININNST